MTNIPENLQNATIVIVGASSGFGKGAALKLAKEGANVVVAARRIDLLDELVRDIKAEGGNALAVQTDVSEQEGIRNLAQKSAH